MTSSKFRVCADRCPLFHFFSRGFIEPLYCLRYFSHNSSSIDITIGKGIPSGRTITSFCFVFSTAAVRLVSPLPLLVVFTTHCCCCCCFYICCYCLCLVRMLRCYYLILNKDRRLERRLYVVVCFEASIIVYDRCSRKFLDLFSRTNSETYIIRYFDVQNDIVEHHRTKQHIYLIYTIILEYSLPTKHSTNYTLKVIETISHGDVLSSACIKTACCTCLSSPGYFCPARRGG